MTNTTNPHWGSTLDDFLKDEGVYQATKTNAVMRVVAWQLAQEMERQGISRTDLAARMHTSRAQINRVLNAESNVTLETLQRAAALVGREIRLELQ
jgi:predicted transcriptional regulator